jgi:tetratricopeptide (TPR) repeat protein
MKIVADCLSIQSAAMLMTHAPWDFMAVYYDAIDHFGHAFMRYHPPKRDHIDEWDYRVFHHCLEAGYCLHDQMLGELLGQAGEGLTVILMSDHGFHPDHLRPLSIPREPAGPAVEHRQLGIFVANGPGLRKDERVYGASILDICPTLLHLFGLPVGEDMDGKVLLDIYEEAPAPIARIPSWDAVEGDHGMHPPDRRIAPADSKAAIAQLAALGYIDNPGEDKEKAMEETVRELEYNLAVAYLDGGLFIEATGILERLYDRWPGEHRFGFRLATCHQHSRKPDALRALVQKIIERRLSEGEDAVSELKAMKLEDEEARKAERERVEKMKPGERKRFQSEREKLLAKARPNLYSLLYLEAYADFAEKKYEAALTRLEKLDSDYGARLNALILRGELLQRLRRWDEADRAFHDALEIEAEAPGALAGLARSAMALKRFDAAAIYARQSIGLLFFQPKVHYIHGLALYRMGAADDAEYAFLICVTQAPLFSAGYRMLGEIYRRFKPDAARQAHFNAEAKASRKRRKELLENRVENGSLQSVAPLSPVSPPARLQPRSEALAGVPEERIITIVSGLPRSGTSLMMQILEAAGLRIFTDNVREADESNQKGYYEYQKVASLRHSADRSWLEGARGAALKVVAPLLSALPLRLPPGGGNAGNGAIFHYRVIYMEREIEEILLSQEHFLKRIGKESGASAGANGNVAQAYLQQVRDAKRWCASKGVNAISVDYRELVARPKTAIAEVAAFLGVNGRIPEMFACVDPSLYRSRKED